MSNLTEEQKNVTVQSILFTIDNVNINMKTPNYSRK